jgi:hypothetical protein
MKPLRDVRVSPARTELAAWIGAALMVRVTFWLITDRVWEDALITLAHVHNALSGIGLTHHPGEPVTQGFTSALSVLIPLAGEILVRGSGLTVLRVASLAAAAFTIVAGARCSERLALSKPATRLVLAYLALDPLQVFYGMSGMETQVAVAVLLWSAGLALESPIRPARFGASLGIALLARPDFLIWIILALLVQAIRGVGPALRSAVVAIAVAGPWLLFTLVYYGSPIPQTIVAKSIALTNPMTADPISWVGIQVLWHLPTIARTFSPFLEDTFVVATPVPTFAAYGVGAFMLLPRVSPACDLLRLVRATVRGHGDARGSRRARPAHGRGVSHALGRRDRACRGDRGATRLDHAARSPYPARHRGCGARQGRGLST